MNLNPVYRYLGFLFLSYLLCLGSFYLFVGGYIVWSSFHKPALLDLSEKPVGSDFLTYWAASKVARTQPPLAVFSREAISEVEREVIGAEISPRIWNYPPSFLLMVLPLSLLPYLLSFISWLAVTCCGYVYIIRRIIPKNPYAWLFLLFPGAVSNFLYGQNGFLSATFLGLGLLLLDRHPFVGGGVLGLLSYKPQMAFLIPMALTAGRCWKALAGAVISAVGLTLASLLLLGSEVWLGFFKNLPLAAGLLDKAHLWEKMPTVLAAARSAGASHKLAMIIQAVSTALVITAVARVWSRSVSLPSRGSVLACGVILATPYAFAYDLTILALPFAWLGWEAYTKDSIAVEVCLLLVWAFLAWFSLGLPWILKWMGNFPLSQIALLAMFLLAIYRTDRLGTGPSAT
jgi:Glycosyltransferase family 87